MIAIITEKPSVGREIARALGAHEKHDGYMRGRDCIVSWAFGHLVQLALPELYGRKRRSELPFIPERFRLTVKQERKNGKNAVDGAASRQLNVIRRVLGQCESVVNACDAGREGELIFQRCAHKAA
jgi:DNA topoisomerase-3